MNSIFLRSVVVVSICGFITGILELFHQGMPPLVGGGMPLFAYLLQSLSLYITAGAAIGFLSGFVLLVLSRMTGGKLPGRFLRDVVPVGIFLLTYFLFAGGMYPRIAPGIDPMSAGSLGPRGVYLLLIVLSFFVVLEGFLLGPRHGKRPGTFTDMARGFSLFVLLLALCVGSSHAIQAPVGGVDAAWENEDAGRPVVVFGIDGVSWPVVMPLVRAGLLPNMSRLMEKGTYGNFRTVGPPLSSALWTDMATGKERMKHGITGNVVVQEGEYIAAPPRSYHRKVPALWNILSDAGEKVAVANWRVTYPPEEVNGVIASMLIFQEEGKVFPPSLEETIMELTRPKRLVKDETTQRKEAPSDKGPREIADELLSDLSIEEKVFTYLSGSGGYDLYAYYTHATDAVQHLFWRFREPERFRGGLWEETEEKWSSTIENVEQYKNFIDEVHMNVDSILGEVLHNIGGDPVVVIVSDHGQQASKNPLIFVDSHRLLQLAGLMEFDAESRPDFERSRMYPLLPMTMTNVSGLAVNLKGREKHGWIEPGAESEKVIGDAVSALQSIKVVETGEPFFNFVRGPGEIGEWYEGFHDRVDILLKCNQKAYGKDLHIRIGDQEYPVSEIAEVRGISGTHTNMGLFLISSPRFKTGVLLPALNTMSTAVMRSWMRESKGRVKQLLLRICFFFNLYEEVETLDLTPTLLYEFGLPVGRDMDGKVHLHLVKEEALEARQLAFVDTYDHIQVTRPDIEQTGETEEMEEDEMEMLRALGYIK